MELIIKYFQLKEAITFPDLQRLYEKLKQQGVRVGELHKDGINNFFDFYYLNGNKLGSLFLNDKNSLFFVKQAGVLVEGELSDFRIETIFYRKTCYTGSVS